MPYEGGLVMGVMLTPSTGRPAGATITVTTDAQEPGWQDASRRADGRRYRWRPGSGRGDVGQYLLQWPTYCRHDREPGHHHLQPHRAGESVAGDRLCS